MYAYLKGTLVSVAPSHIIVEVQGIGYHIYIPGNVFGQLPQVGEAVQIHTSYVIREFAHSLFGFLSIEEKEIFETLMNISGVGPKLALNLIGHLSLPQLQAAIDERDLSALCRVPGVGKKTAERLVVELKDKLPQLSVKSLAVAVQVPIDPRKQQIQDAMTALINLGYHQSVAQKAIRSSLKELPEEVDLATLITTALKNV